MKIKKIKKKSLNAIIPTIYYKEEENEREKRTEAAHEV